MFKSASIIVDLLFVFQLLNYMFEGIWILCNTLLDGYMFRLILPSKLNLITMK